MRFEVPWTGINFGIDSGCFMTHKLSQLLDPESVAIIGVSENPSRIGGPAIRPFLIYPFQSIAPLSLFLENMFFPC